VKQIRTYIKSGEEKKMKIFRKKLHRIMNFTMCMVLVLEVVNCNNLLVRADADSNTTSGNDYAQESNLSDEQDNVQPQEQYTNQPVISDNDVYEEVAYKINYVNVDAAAVEGAPTSYVSSEAVTLPTELVNAKNYTYFRKFTGWYTDADLTQKITEIPVRSTGDVTVYAGFSYKSGLYLLKANPVPKTETTGTSDCIEYDESEFIPVGNAWFTHAYDEAYKTYAEIQDAESEGYEADKTKIEGLMSNFSFDVTDENVAFDAQTGVVSYVENGITYSTNLNEVNWYVIKRVYQDSRTQWIKYDIDGVAVWTSDAPEEEPTTPEEEPTTPKEEPTTPVEEPTTPEENPTTPVEEPTTPVEESTPSTNPTPAVTPSRSTTPSTTPAVTVEADTDAEEAAPIVAQTVVRTTVVPATPEVVEIEDEDAPLAETIDEVTEEEVVEAMSEDTGISKSAEDEDVVVIPEEETPLAAGHCWIHWLILLITLAYLAYELVRGFQRNNKIKKLGENAGTKNATI